MFKTSRVPSNSPVTGNGFPETQLTPSPVAAPVEDRAKENELVHGVPTVVDVPVPRPLMISTLTTLNGVGGPELVPT